MIFFAVAAMRPDSASRAIESGAAEQTDSEITNWVPNYLLNMKSPVHTESHTQQDAVPIRDEASQEGMPQLDKRVGPNLCSALQ